MAGTSGSSGTKQMAKKFVGALLGVAMLIFLGGAVYHVFPTATNQGYRPVQPIPFSHKLHAGDRKMDCKYCHVNVTKSKHATIPSVNVCMNCHSVVKTESPHIQKIQQAFKEGKPIEWVRVHELPDFVVFNHQPHIRAGVSCESCHGDVKRMDVIAQDQLLTMGWCLKCHRGETTPPQVLAKVHPTLKDPRGHHVNEMATSCSTCHQ